jgi:TPR repeat protein
MAQWNVATLYKHGDGVACNPALAALYFAGAAAQGMTCPPEGDLVA